MNSAAELSTYFDIVISLKSPFLRGGDFHTVNAFEPLTLELEAFNRR